MYWGSDAATKLTSHALATGLVVFPRGFGFWSWLESWGKPQRGWKWYAILLWCQLRRAPGRSLGESSSLDLGFKLSHMCCAADLWLDSKYANMNLDAEHVLRIMIYADNTSSTTFFISRGQNGYNDHESATISLHSYLANSAGPGRAWQRYKTSIWWSQGAGTVTVLLGLWQWRAIWDWWRLHEPLTSSMFFLEEIWLDELRTYLHTESGYDFLRIGSVELSGSLWWTRNLWCCSSYPS